MANRFFFDTIGDDWFMIPLDERERWEKMTACDPSTDDEWDSFGKFRIDGAPCGYSFIQPEQIDVKGR